MLYSINGKVIDKDKNRIIVETSGIGYEILVSRPDDFEINKDIFLYLHHEIKEDDEYLAGFSSKEEMHCFRLLLHVNGIGPKTAVQILSYVNYDDLLTAISNNDFDYIRSIPYINSRIASQIILDLQTFLEKTNRENKTQYLKVKEALKALKFKVKEIDKVLPGIFIPNGTDQDILKEALRRLKNGKIS